MPLTISASLYRLVLVALLFVFNPFITANAQPVNDECSGAILLPVNNDASCTSTTVGTQALATQSLNPCINTGFAAIDVWFKFVATRTTHQITVTSHEYRDKIFEVYSGACNSLVSLACVNSGGLGLSDKAIVNNLTVGATYYIRVFDWWANTGQSEFDICINSATSFLQNDECAGAISVPVTPNIEAQVSYPTLGATQSRPGCHGTAEDDIWFKFTATHNRHLVWVGVNYDYYDPVVEVFEGDCSNLVSKVCWYTSGVQPNISHHVDVTGLVPGNTYYYRVYGKSANNLRAEVRTSVTPLPPPPANDECAGAIMIPVNNDASCTLTTVGTQELSTQSMPPCINTGYRAIDSWFKFVATSATHRITVSPHAFRDKIFQVYSGSCNNLVSIACVNSGGANASDMVLLNNLVPGNTYYIRVYDYYANFQLSEFTICISTTTTLISNDDCSGAVNVPVGSTPVFTSPYSTLSATQSMPGCVGTAEDDIWFKFTATANRHRIYISAGDYINAVLEVLEGSCASLVSKGCFHTDAFNGGSIYGDLNALTPGNTYYFRVYGKGANDARVEVRAAIIPLPPAPANDECSGAITVPVSSDGNCTSPVTGTQEFSTQSMPACTSTGNIAADVWFKFVATATTHRIAVTPLAYRDLLFQVFSGSCGNFTSIACVNNTSSNEAEIILLNNLTPGNTYYMRVYDRYANINETSFTICVTSVPALIPNDECSGAIQIPVTSTPDFPDRYFTQGATQSRPGCIGTAEDDVWFKFTATGTRHLIWVTNSNDELNPVIELFGGTCAGLVSRFCYSANYINPASISADVSGLVAGNTYYYRVYGRYANSVRSEIRTSVVALPAQLIITVTANPIGAICKGESVTYSATVNHVGDQPVYQWKLNGVNAGTNSSSFTPTDLKNGDIISLAFSTTISGATFSGTSNAITQQVFDLTKPVVQAQGPVTFCEGGTVILQTAATGNLQWVRNGTAINGATGQSYTATASGNYYVVLSNVQCSVNSDAVAVTVNPMPVKPTVQVQGPVTFCEGGTVILQTAATGNLQWALNGTAINGATGQSYTATAAGNYHIVVGVTGCKVNSDAVTITTKPVPAKPSINQLGNILTSSATLGNQWLKNGVVIPGATAQTFVASEAGEYSVSVIVNGCVTHSDKINLSAGIFTGGFADKKVLIFPNPVPKEFIVSNVGLRKLVIQVVNSMGRVVLETRANDAYKTIHAGTLFKGVYFVRVIDIETKETITKTILKL